MAESQADSNDGGNANGYNLWTYEADPGDWEHMQDDYWKERKDTFSRHGSWVYDFPDWVLDLVRVPPSGLEIQRLADDAYPCLECGYPAQEEAQSGCGPGCWNSFRNAMKEYAKRIEIWHDQHTGQGAWLKEGELDCTHIIGLYMGITYPEHPKDKWGQSDYVYSINGVDYEIENFRQTHTYFRPQYGGPTRAAETKDNPDAFTATGRRRRGQELTIFPPSVYDTETYGVMVDAATRGIWTRFLNSSCDPNLETSSEQVGKVRVSAFRPVKGIKEGQELTFYYGEGFFTEHGIQCRCACAAAREPHAAGTYAPNNATDKKAKQLPRGLRPPEESPGETSDSDLSPPPPSPKSSSSSEQSPSPESPQDPSSPEDTRKRRGSKRKLSESPEQERLLERPGKRPRVVYSIEDSEEEEEGQDTEMEEAEDETPEFIVISSDEEEEGQDTEMEDAEDQNVQGEEEEDDSDGSYVISRIVEDSD